MVHDKCHLKIFRRALGICSVEYNNLCSFRPGHYEEHFCKKMNLDPVVQEMLFTDISYLEL